MKKAGTSSVVHNLHSKSHEPSHRSLYSFFFCWRFVSGKRRQKREGKHTPNITVPISTFKEKAGVTFTTNFLN